MDTASPAVDAPATDGSGTSPRKSLLSKFVALADERHAICVGCSEKKRLGFRARHDLQPPPDAGFSAIQTRLLPFERRCVPCTAKYRLLLASYTHRRLVVHGVENLWQAAEAGALHLLLQFLSEARLRLEREARWQHVPGTPDPVIGPADVLRRAGDYDRARGYTALQLALSSSADIYTKGLVIDGSTIKGSQFRLEAVSLLLEAGCDPDAGIMLSRTRPIHMAAALGDRRLLEALLAHGADVYRTDKAGRNALHYARGSDAVHILIREGLTTADRDKTGNTPLMLAIQAEEAREADEEAGVLQPRPDGGPSDGGEGEKRVKLLTRLGERRRHEREVWEAQEQERKAKLWSELESRREEALAKRSRRSPPKLANQVARAAAEYEAWRKYGVVQTKAPPVSRADEHYEQVMKDAKKRKEKEAAAKEAARARKAEARRKRELREAMEKQLLEEYKMERVENDEFEAGSWGPASSGSRSSPNRSSPSRSTGSPMSSPKTSPHTSPDGSPASLPGHGGKGRSPGSNSSGSPKGTPPNKRKHKPTGYQAFLASPLMAATGAAAAPSPAGGAAAGGAGASLTKGGGGGAEGGAASGTGAGSSPTRPGRVQLSPLGLPLNASGAAGAASTGQPLPLSVPQVIGQGSGVSTGMTVGFASLSGGAGAVFSFNLGGGSGSRSPMGTGQGTPQRRTLSPLGGQAGGGGLTKLPPLSPLHASGLAGALAVDGIGSLPGSGMGSAASTRPSTAAFGSGTNSPRPGTSIGGHLAGGLGMGLDGLSMGMGMGMGMGGGMGMTVRTPPRGIGTSSGTGSPQAGNSPRRGGLKLTALGGSSNLSPRAAASIGAVTVTVPASAGLGTGYGSLPGTASGKPRSPRVTFADAPLVEEVDFMRQEGW